MLDSVTTVRRLVTFYVDEHNRVLPHSAFRGQTPDEMYFGTGDAVPADLTSRAAAARRTRVEATVRRLVAFYADEHNRALPHSAFRGQTPDEMYFGTGDAVPADLSARAAAARRARGEANRSAACAACPAVDAAA